MKTTKNAPAQVAAPVLDKKAIKLPVKKEEVTPVKKTNTVKATPAPATVTLGKINFGFYRATKDAPYAHITSAEGTKQTHRALLAKGYKGIQVFNQNAVSRAVEGDFPKSMNPDLQAYISSKAFSMKPTSAKVAPAPPAPEKAPDAPVKKTRAVKKTPNAPKPDAPATVCPLPKKHSVKSA